jgi:hypothetical protein
MGRNWLSFAGHSVPSEKNFISSQSLKTYRRSICKTVRHSLVTSSDCLKVSCLMILRWWQCLWGEITSLNCGHQVAYCSSLRWYVSMGNRDGIMSTEDNNWFVHKSTVTVLPEESSGSKQEERGKGMMDAVLRSIFVYSCLRIASLPKEGVLQIFIAHKNSSLRLGLNPRTSGLMARTVTITTPGRHEVALRVMKVNYTSSDKDSNLGFRCCTNIVTLAIT